MPSFALNDIYIEQLIYDYTFDIRRDGSIWARKPLGGKPKENKIYPLRKMGHIHTTKRKDGNISHQEYIVNYTVSSNKNFHLQVSRVIYRKFVGPLDQSLEVNHKDDNSLNNIPENLELIEKVKNVKLSHKNLRMPIGEHHQWSKLTEENVKEIKKLFKQNYNNVEIGKKFNVDPTTIRAIKIGRTWVNVSI